LKAADVAVRMLGDPMSFWRDSMPKGMMLRSPWHATHIADPLRQYSLDVFARRHGIAPVRSQLPLAQFLRYGRVVSAAGGAGGRCPQGGAGRARERGISSPARG